jgi:hypothetical protein
MSVSGGEEPHSHRYISVPKAVQLIPKFFKGNTLEMREFIQNAEFAYEVADPLVRACFIQGLHDDRIKTMVKAKGNVNTPMAQLVEVALEEESSIRSERFKRGNWEKEPQKNYGTRHAPQGRFERKGVRVALITCYRCQKMGHI